MSETLSKKAPPRLWRRRLGDMGGLFLGVVLLLGALSKAVDPQAFAEQIQVEGLDFALSADKVALIALALEFALGTALVLGVRRLWVLIPTSLLVVFFFVITGRSYWNYAHGIVDESVSCGCFGNLVDRTPAEAFWQDALLMAPALVVAYLGRFASSFPTIRTVVVILVTLAGVVLTAASPRLPLDDVATRLKPGKVVGQICSGAEDYQVCLIGVVPELAQGEHIVVIGDLSSEEFGESVKILNPYHLSGQGPMLWVLHSSSPEQQHQFFWQWAPTFRLVDAPRALLRPLYRELPRSFLLSDGRVTRTFSGLPPFHELARAVETSEPPR